MCFFAHAVFFIPIRSLKSACVIKSVTLLQAAFKKGNMQLDQVI